MSFCWRLIVVLFLAVLPSEGHADFVFNSNCRKAYDHIISLRFEEGRRLINEEKRLNPSNGIPYLLENYIDYFGTFISEREDLFKNWKKELDPRIDKIQANDRNSPFYLFAQAQIYLQHAFVRFKFREYATGAYEIHKAYKLLEKNNKLFPSFKANLMCLGVIHSLIGTVPEDYKWLVSLVGMKGTIQQGIKELNLLVTTCRNTEYDYLYPEASVLLSLLQMYIQKDYESASRVMGDVHKTIPEFNPIVCFVQASILLHTGKGDLAIQKVQTRPGTSEYFPIPYLDYLEGIARLNKLDKDSYIYFQRYVNEFKGNSFIKAAYQKLAWYHLIHGNTEKYHEYMRLCKAKAHALIDEDKQALNEAVSGEIPNIFLLRARLYFDGGYYSKALAEIAGNSGDKFPRLKDKTELTYRLARIYQKMGETEKAIEYFLITLKNGEHLKYHFAANSALEMGYIYEKMKDKEKAMTYFKKCLAMRGHEYQNGIDQKAKAAISRLGNL